MHRIALATLLALATSPLFAQVVTTTTPTTTAEKRPLTSRLWGLFDFDLPELDLPGTVKLTLRPHFGDLIRRDYMRVDGGVRWSVSRRFEVSPEASIFFNHGLGDNNDSGYGVGELRLGSKYILSRFPDFDMETSLTLGIETPVGHPPVDMTDGLNHITPGFLVQRQAAHATKWTTFAGAGLDLVSMSDVAGTPVRNQPRDDSMNFTVGAIYDLGQLKYTLSGTYATTAWIGDETHHFFYLRPNVLWYVPKKFTFNSKTQWVVGLGLRMSTGPDGTEVSVSSRVRAEITFRQVMDKLKSIKPTDLIGR